MMGVSFEAIVVENRGLMVMSSMLQMFLSESSGRTSAGMCDVQLGACRDWSHRMTHNTSLHTFISLRDGPVSRRAGLLELQGLPVSLIALRHR